MSAKKRSLKQKDAFERFPPPEIDVETLDESYLFDCALSNTYQQFCGAFDAKDHLLANYIVERNLFNKRDVYGKTVLDLASYCGNKEFIKAVFDRTNEKEKIDENVLNLKQQLKPSNRYNFMHLACIWNHETLVKYFAEHPKLIVDPSLDQNELNSMSAATIQSVKSQITNPMFKTLGSVLLRSKTKTGESPKDLAKRYGHNNLVEYLQYAEKRQEFIDSINDLKSTISDPEKHQNKLSKDEKKKLEKIYVETLDWVEKNKENRNIETLEEKIKETQNEIKPILDNMLTKIHEMNQRNSVSNNLGGVSARSKITTPLVTK